MELIRNYFGSKTVFVLVFCLAGLCVRAQKVEFSTGADLVSSYIWRGVNLGSAAFQPSLSMSYKGFSWGAWGSVALTSPATDEFDLYFSYESNGFTATLTDYSFPSSLTADYSNYEQHQLEVGLAYDFNGKYPFTLAWNTFVAGNDKNASGEQNFSSYFELSYRLAVKSVALDFTLGGTPWRSGSTTLGSIYSTDGPGITSLAVKGSKEIGITERYSLPLFSQIIFNPYSKTAFMVFGISF